MRDLFLAVTLRVTMLGAAVAGCSILLTGCSTRLPDGIGVAGDRAPWGRWFTQRLDSEQRDRISSIESSPAEQAQPARLQDWTIGIGEMLRDSSGPAETQGTSPIRDSAPGDREINMNTATMSDRSISSGESTGPNSEHWLAKSDPNQLPPLVDQPTLPRDLNPGVEPSAATANAADRSGDSGDSPTVYSISDRNDSASGSTGGSAGGSAGGSEDDSVITIQAVPHGENEPPASAPSRSETFDLFDQSHAYPRSGPTQSLEPMQIETVMFQPVDPDQFERRQRQYVGLAGWDEEQDPVIRNEHLAPWRRDLSATDPVELTPVADVASPDRADGREQKDWAAMMAETIDALEKQEAQLPPQRRESIRRAIQIRLLRLSAGDVEGAMRPIAGLAEREQAFWQHQFAALGAMMNPASHRIGEHALPPATAQDVLDSLHHARRELAELAPLQVGRARWCSQVSGFGQYEMMPATFQPGDQTIVYCELQNFSAIPESLPAVDGQSVSLSPTTRHGSAVQYVARLRGSYQILDRQGRVVAQQQYPPIEDHSRNLRTDFYLYFPVTIPDLEEGEYRLNVSIEDVHARKRAELVEPMILTIAAPAPSSQERTADRRDTTSR